MSAPRLRTGAAVVLVLVASCLLLAAAPQAAAPPALPLPIEPAGPDGAVQALVVADGQVAGVVLWPPPDVVEGEALPAGTLAVTAEAALQSALAGETDAKAVVEWGPGFLAIGATVPAGGEDRLLGILARLASPPAAGPAAVASARDAVRARRNERWNDPLERARLGALGLLFPGAIASWNALGSPASIDRVDAGAVQAASAAIRRRPVAVRLAGPSGLAARAVQALGTRLGPIGSGTAPAVAAKLPAAAVLSGNPPGHNAGNVAIALAFRVTPQAAADLGPSLSVLFETLSEGPGSLPQRLHVALKDGVATTIELTPVAGGGGVIVLGVRVKRAGSESAWRVLSGMISSVRALPLMEGAVFRARQRLDEQSAFRATDATAALLGFLRRAPWTWPPADRDRPIAAAEVRLAAREVLAQDGRATLAAGVLPAEVLDASGLRQAPRIEWARFDPTVDGLTTAPPPSGTDPGTVAAVRESREILGALAGGAREGLPPFAARYTVREPTPLGPALSDLRIDGGPDGAVIGVSTGKWRIEAHGNDESSEATVPGASTTSPLVEADRLPALLYREPAIFADAAARGAVPVTLVNATCGDGPCGGLRAELGEGSVLLLLYDRATKRPKEMLVWYLGHDASRRPDETIAYTEFRDAGGVQVVGGMTIRDSLGTSREVHLVDWSWKTDKPAPVQ